MSLPWTLWVVIYVTTWVICISFVIPFHTHVAPEKHPDHLVTVPEKPNIRRILIINTVLATSIVLALYLLIHFQIFTMPEV